LIYEKFKISNYHLKRASIASYRFSTLYISPSLATGLDSPF